MTLFLVQHGEAKQENEDPDRSLTDRGAEVVERMADWAARSGITVNQIFHSGKRRAEQTAAIFVKHLNPSRGVTELKGLSPNDDVTTVSPRSRATRNRSCSSDTSLISAAWSACW